MKPKPRKSKSSWYKIVVLRKGRTGSKWYWKLTSYNNKTLAHSETYSSKGAAKNTARKLHYRLSNSVLIIN